MSPTAHDAATKVADLFGPVAAREAQAAGDHHAPGLIEYADTLIAADDRTYIQMASCAIWDAANSAQFRTPYHEADCKQSMCYAESERRRLNAGHTQECRATTLYDRAYNAAVRDAGYRSLARETRDCTCDITR